MVHTSRWQARWIILNSGESTAGIDSDEPDAGMSIEINTCSDKVQGLTQWRFEDMHVKSVYVRTISLLRSLQTDADVFRANV